MFAIRLDATAPHKRDPKTGKVVGAAPARAQFSDADKAQREKDEAEHAQRMAAPKPPTLDERIEALETAVAALKRASK